MRQWAIAGGPAATLISAGDPDNPIPTLIQNIDPLNTLYLGNDPGINPLNPNTCAPVLPGQSTVSDGSMNVFGIAAAGQVVSVNTYRGVSSFFLPASLSSIGGAAVFVQPGTPTGTNIPVNSLWFNTANGSMLTWTGSAWSQQQFSGSQLISAASILAGQIANQAVTTAKIANGAVGATQVASGSLTSAQLAAAAGILGTQIANATVTGANIAANTIVAANIAANTITAAQLAAGIIYSGIVDTTTVKAAQYIASGTSGEFLAYAGPPALGNLVAALSPVAGSDSFGNAYTAGLLVNQGQLILANSATPAPSSVGPVLFGQSNGALQVVDSLDSQLYATEYRMRVASANVRTVSTSATVCTDFNFNVVPRSYFLELVGVGSISGANATGMFIRFSGPATSFVLAPILLTQESTTGQQQFSSHAGGLGVFNTSPSFPSASNVQFRLTGYVSFSASGQLQVQIACAAASQQWDLLAGTALKIYPI